MLVADIDDFVSSLHMPCRLVGLDHGSKTIGIALSDINRTIATPHSTINRTKLAADMAILKNLVKEQQVGGFVVGYPLNVDGSEGPRCQSVRAFVRNLESVFDLPVLLEDERFSTDIAMDAMKLGSLSHQKRGAHKDKVAAALILQAVLDRLP